MRIAPLCDRRNHNLSKSQVGFINFIVRPSFKPFCGYLGNSLWMDRLEVRITQAKPAVGVVAHHNPSHNNIKHTKNRATLCSGETHKWSLRPKSLPSPAIRQHMACLT